MKSASASDASWTSMIRWQKTEVEPSNGAYLENHGFYSRCASRIRGRCDSKPRLTVWHIVLESKQPHPVTPTPQFNATSDQPTHRTQLVFWLTVLQSNRGRMRELQFDWPVAGQVLEVELAECQFQRLMDGFIHLRNRPPPANSILLNQDGPNSTQLEWNVQSLGNASSSGVRFRPQSRPATKSISEEIMKTLNELYVDGTLYCKSDGSTFFLFGKVILTYDDF